MKKWVSWEKELGVKPEGSSGETILQRRLRAFEDFDISVKAMRRKFKRIKDAMAEDMRQGATVEPGRLGLKGGITVVHRVKAKDEIIRLAGGGERGERHYERLKGRSQTHAYFHVRLIRNKKAG